MSYDCVCDSDVEFYRSEARKARKQHSCYECGGAILPGDKYESVFGIQDGSTYYPKTCERCVDIRQWVKNNVPCFCWMHGNMIDDAKEAIDEAVTRAPEETGGLQFGLLRRIAERDCWHKDRLPQPPAKDHQR